MTLETLALWVIVGGIAGLLAEAVVKVRRMGILGAVIVGVLGAFTGVGCLVFLDCQSAVG